MIHVTRCQPSVRFALIAPAGFRILAAIDSLPALLSRDIFISCGTEAHPLADPHSTGEAYDVSVMGWSGVEIETALTALRQTLGPLFYAQYEVQNSASDLTPSRLAVVNPNATGSHLHTQRRKGTIYPPVNL